MEMPFRKLKIVKRNGAGAANTDKTSLHSVTKQSCKWEIYRWQPEWQGNDRMIQIVLPFDTVPSTDAAVSEALFAIEQFC